MYSVSNDFLTAVRQPGRVFKSKVTAKKAGYADINLTDAQIMSIKLSTSSISGENFEIGTTCAAQLDIEIANLDGSLTTAAFQDAQVLASIGVVLSDGVTVEYCPLGVFFVDTPSRTDSSIKLTCYDAMVQLETLYQSTLTYPATLLQIAQDIAGKAGLTLANTTFPNATFTVQTEPNLAGVTLRSALSWVAQASANFARISREGELELAFYTATSTSITPANYFTLTHDDQPRAAITQVTIKQSNDDTGISSGTAGNTYTITGNPLLANNPGGALTAIFNQLNGFSYMPFQSDWQGNPACMVGDAITITDRASNIYNTIFTECDFVYEGGVKGTAEAKALTVTGQNHQTAAVMSAAVNTAVQTAQQVSYDVAQINNLLAGNITATNIAAGTITADRLKAGTITAASGVIANAAIDTVQIKDAAIVTAKIADAAISTAKIASAAINTAQIAIGAITTALIGTGAVNTAQIADGSITDAKIVTLTANKITAGTIDASKITVTNLNCANLTVGTINGTQISNGAITSANIQDASIQGTDIKIGTITNNLISAATITGDKLVAGTITASQIASATITGNNIAANTITAGNIAAGAITATQIAANTITATQIASGSITGDRIAAGTITADKINTTNLSVYKLAAQGNENDYAIMGAGSNASFSLYSSSSCNFLNMTVDSGAQAYIFSPVSITLAVADSTPSSYPYPPSVSVWPSHIELYAQNTTGISVSDIYCNNTVTISGQLVALTGEAHFSNGSYSDPASGVNCGAKVSGNFACGTLYVNGQKAGGYWNCIPVITGGGVMEIGKYIDFHNSANDGVDNQVRLTGNTGNLTCSGAFYASSIFSGGSHCPNSQNIGNIYFNASGNYLTINTDSNGAWGINAWASDMRLKKNVKDSTIDALAKILAIKHRSFNWLSDNSEVANGYVAQELKNIDNALVFSVPQPEGSVNPDLYQIDISGLIPLITKAIQELNSKIEDLQKQIKGKEE